MDLPRVVPLFPLPNVVLFPRMSLPLHVFEPRYRKMVADALEAGQAIGMVLLRPGWESDYLGRPPVFPVGCAGRIASCDPLPDGRFELLLRGYARFRIVEEHAGEPYRLASVEPAPERQEDPASLDGARKRVLAAVGNAADGPTELVLQGDLPHEVFVNALSQTMALEALERQSLLEADSLLARYARLAEILEFRALERAHGGAGDRVH